MSDQGSGPFRARFPFTPKLLMFVVPSTVRFPVMVTFPATAREPPVAAASYQFAPSNIHRELVHAFGVVSKAGARFGMKLPGKANVKPPVPFSHSRREIRSPIAGDPVTLDEVTFPDNVIAHALCAEISNTGVGVKEKVV